MRYRLHPEAALEHAEQVAYYEAITPGLGKRYHAAFRAAVLQVCEAPDRYKMVQPPAIRRASLRGFPFSILFRVSEDVVQVLAIAHHRRRPSYWVNRR